MRILITCLVALLIPAADAIAAKVSRANCWNNESISYGLYKWRVVFSYHIQNGVRKHYVTANPPSVTTCVPGAAGFHQTNGLWCAHFFTRSWRHAGIHGSILPTESWNDGNLNPLSPTNPWDWVVEGDHHTWIKPINKLILQTTWTDDCSSWPDEEPIPL